jgi:hypothetical protein
MGMVASLLVALAVAPWSQPLTFGHLPGWHTGRSGNTRTASIGHGAHVAVPLEAAAWAARGVRYRDEPTADPPNATLRHLPRHAVVVWAVISNPFRGDRPIQLDLKAAQRVACCEATRVAGGDWELSGSGPRHAYSVIVRISFGSPPTRAMRTEAQDALDALRLPSAR